jgi:outer membrane lipoprotein-sorting protein
MKRLATLAFLAAPLAAAALAPAAVSAQTASPLDQVSAHLKAVGTMTAAFTQSGRGGQTLNGQLTLKRPGKVRFQYGQGVPMLIVGDGKSLTMIDYQVKQVSRWPIGNSPLSVLLDPNKNLAKIAKVLPSSDDRVVMLQARDPARPEFGTITLAFARVSSAPAGLMLQGWTTVDAQKNRSTVKLSNQRFNVPVAETAFRYVDPRKKAGLKS